MKERLDILLVKRGLAPSREKAKAMIMSGCVFVDGQREDKAGTSFPEDPGFQRRHPGSSRTATGIPPNIQTTTFPLPWIRTGCHASNSRKSERSVSYSRLGRRFQVCARPGLP